MEVLFEQDVKGERGCYRGLTSNYIKVLCKGESCFNGQVLKVKLNEATEDYIRGHIEN